MNLKKTYCASYCKNYSCKDMLSYSVLKAAERLDIEVKYADLSETCTKFKQNNEKAES